MAYPESKATYQHKPKWLNDVMREERPPSGGVHTAGAASGEGRLEKIKAMERASGGAVSGARGGAGEAADGGASDDEAQDISPKRRAPRPGRTAGLTLKNPDTFARGSGIGLERYAKGGSVKAKKRAHGGGAEVLFDKNQHDAERPFGNVPTPEPPFKGIRSAEGALRSLREDLRGGDLRSQRTQEHLGEGVRRAPGGSVKRTRVKK